MPNRIHHLRRDERGMSFAFIGFCMAAFIGAATLAIDVGMFMNARTQAQNSADAGALAGVTALVVNDWNNRSSAGPAVQSAISAATHNLVISRAPTVLPADVTFPLSPSGESNRVKVDVHRVGPNGVQTVMGSWFGLSTVDINATATAEASPANAMTCVKPFMIPDKWTEHIDDKCNPDGSWTTSSTFDEFDNRGNLCANPDQYVAAGTNGTYTGYTIGNDVGTQLVLRASNGTKPNPSFYYSWKMPGDTGGSFYRDNIENCNTSVITYDPNNPYIMTQEPGNMSGPTAQGIQALIDKDPNARWDSSCKCVVNSAYSGQSPRVFPIPLFNPQYYAEGIQNGRVASFELANFLGFFADHVDNGGQIFGIITTIIGVVDPNAGPVPKDLIPRAIRLVQ